MSQTVQKQDTHLNSAELASITRGDREAPIANCEVYRMSLKGSSGKIIAPPNGVESWVGGTGPNGEYIPPHTRLADGRIAAPRPDSNISIRDANDLARLLELEPTGAAGVFRRPGYSGNYIAQQERDGTLSLFYEGGRHISGKRCSAQTFHHGQWDVSRRIPEEVSQPQPSKLQFNLPPNSQPQNGQPLNGQSQSGQSQSGQPQSGQSQNSQPQPSQLQNTPLSHPLTPIPRVTLPRLPGTGSSSSGTTPAEQQTQVSAPSTTAVEPQLNSRREAARRELARAEAQRREADALKLAEQQVEPKEQGKV